MSKRPLNGGGPQLEVDDGRHEVHEEVVLEGVALGLEEVGAGGNHRLEVLPGGCKTALRLTGLRGGSHGLGSRVRRPNLDRHPIALVVDGKAALERCHRPLPSFPRPTCFSMNLTDAPITPLPHSSWRPGEKLSRFERATTHEKT